MKKLIAITLIAAGIAAIMFASCGTSEGRKFATLQKVSHNSFPSYYKVEVAYEGGRSVSEENGSGMENTQEFEITKEGYDTLQKYLGEKIVFDYKDRTFNFSGPDRVITYIEIKKIK